MGQTQAQPAPLPAIFDDGRVLGPVGAPFAVEAYHRDDLVVIIRIERNQREVVNVIDVSEVSGLPIGQLLYMAKEAQANRPFAKAAVEPLQRGRTSSGRI